MKKEVFGADKLVAEIIASATAPVTYPWMKIPRVVFQCATCWCTGHIVPMVSLPTLRNGTSKYIVEEIGTLDFLNEWEGFMSVNSSVRVVSDVQNVGDRIITEDGTVYRVHGFNYESGNADVYTNVV